MSAAIHGSLWAYAAKTTGWSVRSSLVAWNRGDTMVIMTPARNATDPIRSIECSNSGLFGSSATTIHS